MYAAMDCDERQQWGRRSAGMLRQGMRASAKYLASAGKRYFQLLWNGRGEVFDDFQGVRLLSNNVNDIPSGQNCQGN